MLLWEQLQLRPGLICLTGSGGKTALAHLLSASLPGRVIFCTSTRIFPSPALPLFLGSNVGELDALLERRRAVCVGVLEENGKLSAPAISFQFLRSLADYVVVEADGAKGLPLKAHLSYEPVLPDCFDRCILLVGASGFDRPILEAAHRPERFAELAGCHVCDPATPDAAASVLAAEGGFDTVIVNQASSSELISRAGRLFELLGIPGFAGEIKNGSLVSFTGNRDIIP